MPIVVVGAADTDGTVASWAQYNPPPGVFSGAAVDVWAPAVDTICAYNLPGPQPVVPGQLAQYFGGCSIGKYNSCFIMEYDSDFVIATAQASGLIAYFLGVPKHLAAINTIRMGIFSVEGDDGVAWSQAIKQYLKQLAYPRCNAPPPPGVPQPNEIYNGENPLLRNGQPAIQKRQAAPSCPANLTVPQWRFIVPVFPDINDTNVEQDYGLIDNFTLRLKAETNPDTLWVSSDSTNWTSFWIQQLDDPQVDEYSSDPAVSIICILNRFDS
jgi:hypothetical protein